MSAAASDDHESDEARTAPPSKSARKRSAHAVQQLGESLTALPDAELAALALPAELAEAIRAARGMTSRAAAARQRQYIGKLMRGVDPAPIRAALAALGKPAAREAEYFRRAESWRERLLREGAPALAELERSHPQIDRAVWAERVRAARSERTRGTGTGAGRELFRALRALFGTMPR